MKNLSPIFLKDFYKVSHYEQYPKGTTLIFSNFTPRKIRNESIKKVVCFGFQYLIKEYLVDRFKDNFFNRPLEHVISEYRHFMNQTLGVDKPWDHIEALHKLGYLPIAIHALKEGTKVDAGVPIMTIYNTHNDFFWVTNALETLISSVLWGMCNSASIAYRYRQILDFWAKKTSDNPGFVEYQGHDFSFRGMMGPEAAAMSGAAHLLSFKGTDTIPAIHFLYQYYRAPLNCGTSVPATEHSVMGAGGDKNELETFKRLITEIYPKGIVSIVSDTWNLWTVINEYLPQLKDIIMAREGKVVIRPDSGDPVEILCGTESNKGVIEYLWDIFGGTINSKGFKELDPHIGAIYGDSITINKCHEICSKLLLKGFASTNVVFGIGSYTYQYNTRDTLGFAMKATYAEINGVGVPIFKKPFTDDGTKNSHKGITSVIEKISPWDGRRTLKTSESNNFDEFNSGTNKLNLIFFNGSWVEHSFELIRERLHGN